MSGNEFVESKIFVVCENLILKKLFHNAEISKMAANVEVSN